MKVTPLDIRRKEFKRSVRGYSDEEVDLFLDEVADELERLLQENVELQDRIRKLEEQVVGNDQLRGALEKTLVSAQIQADLTRADAQKESELVLREAEIRARGIVSDSYSEVQRVQQALVQLKRLEEDFRFKFRSLLEGHLKLLEEAPIGMPAAQPGVVAGTSAVAAPEPSPVEDATFMVPPAVEEVPEYPAVPQVVRAESSFAPEPASGVGNGGSEEPAASPAHVGDATFFAGEVAEPAAEPGPIVAPEPAAGSSPASMTEAAPVQASILPSEPPVQESDIWATAVPAGDTGDTETATVEQAAMLSDFDQDKAEVRPNDDESPEAAPAEDTLSRFFFGAASDVTEDTLSDGDRGGTSKPRDFEW